MKIHRIVFNNFLFLPLILFLSCLVSASELRSSVKGTIIFGDQSDAFSTWKNRSFFNRYIDETSACLGPDQHPVTMKIIISQDPEYPVSLGIDRRSRTIILCFGKQADLVNNKELNLKIINALLLVKLDLPEKTDLSGIIWVSSGIYNSIRKKSMPGPQPGTYYPGVSSLFNSGNKIDIEKLLTMTVTPEDGKYLNSFYDEECGLLLDYICSIDEKGAFLTRYVREIVQSGKRDKFKLLISILMKQNMFELISVNERETISGFINEQFNTYALRVVFNSDTPASTGSIIEGFNSAMKFEYRLNGKTETSDVSRLPELWKTLDSPEDTRRKITNRFEILFDISPALLKPCMSGIAGLLSSLPDKTGDDEFKKRLVEYKKSFAEASSRQQRLDAILDDMELNYFSPEEEYKDYFEILASRKDTVSAIYPQLSSYVDRIQ